MIDVIIFIVVSVADVLFSLWDATFGQVLGPVIEIIKDIAKELVKIVTKTITKIILDALNDNSIPQSSEFRFIYNSVISINSELLLGDIIDSFENITDYIKSEINSLLPLSTSVNSFTKNPAINGLAQKSGLFCLIR